MIERVVAAYAPVIAVSRARVDPDMEGHRVCSTSTIWSVAGLVPVLELAEQAGLPGGASCTPPGT